jgi:hypothetical protein
VGRTKKWKLYDPKLRSPSLIIVRCENKLLERLLSIGRLEEMTRERSFR